VYSYDVTDGNLTNPIAALRLGGFGSTSGFIVDNQSTTQIGAQQIYFSNPASGFPNTAIQASQTTLQ